MRKPQIRSFSFRSVLFVFNNRHANMMPIMKNYLFQSYTVPMTDRSYPSSPIKKEVLSFRKSAPEIKPNFTLSSSSKVNQLINDRQQVSI